ncbi:DUF1127 domain-containing protein [Nisaea acidiphila]|uniref:DUF1127 domain-containing protein n=1 Tax=Nisaea acidiphila TaxID=1862145 RepID=A0A9J7AUJ9_9PROT|nr:DUF1127 domain-containing protein [Nisaea acidiphila]UUX49077.1 DUF1127 domain-containing protein [Nisaea acidiphila]
MNYYKLSHRLDGLQVQEAGPFVARVADPDEIVIRRHSLFTAEMQIRQEWNRYIGALLVNGAKTMFKTLINRLRTSRTMAELNALDDRMLADIGLYRSDIAHVARKLAEGTTEPVAAKTIIAPMAAVAEIPAVFTGEAANTDEHREAA